MGDYEVVEEQKKDEIKQPTNSVPIEDKGLMIRDRNGAVISYREMKDLEREVEERTKREFGITGGGREFRSPTSIGVRFEEALNQKFTDTVMGEAVNKMFGGGSSVQRQPGIVSGILSEPAIANMLGNFGKGVGDHLGEHLEHIANIFGKETVKAVAKQAGLPVQDTQAEQQKMVEDMVLNLNPNNASHVQEYMKALIAQGANVTSIEQAKQILINQQNNIRQSRGEPVQQIQNEVVTKENTPKDMNRQLIERYEQGGQQENIVSDSFFNSQPVFGNNQQSPDDVVLSLSPDDPASIHIYASMRNLKNLDEPTIKRTLIKEQEHLRSKMLTPPTIQDMPVSPDDDAARLNKSAPVNEFLVVDESKLQENINQSNTNPPVVEVESNTNKDEQPLNAFESEVLKTLRELSERVQLLENEKRLVKEENQVHDTPVEEIIPPIQDSLVAPDESTINPPQEPPLVISTEFDNKISEDADLRELKEEVKEDKKEVKEDKKEVKEDKKEVKEEKKEVKEQTENRPKFIVRKKAVNKIEENKPEE